MNREAIENTIKEVETKLAECKAQLAALDKPTLSLSKPELRHLHYGYAPNGEMRVIIKQCGGDFGGYFMYADACYEYSILPGNECSGRLDQPGAVILGNTVDDLTLYAQDFETKIIDIGYGETVVVSIDGNEGDIRIDLCVVGHLSLNQAIELGHTLIHAAHAIRREAK